MEKHKKKSKKNFCPQSIWSLTVIESIELTIIIAKLIYQRPSIELINLKYLVSEEKKMEIKINCISTGKL